MNFPEQLKAKREQLGMTQADLASFMDVSPRAIWQWEKGKLPHILTQEGAIARLSKAELAALLGETRETISRRERSESIAKRDEFALLWIAQQNTKTSIPDLLRRAEIDYTGAVIEYDKAAEKGVSCFYEHNVCSYFMGIRDAYRNLLNQNLNNERLKTDHRNTNPCDGRGA